jgi:hypothetical protein
MKPQDISPTIKQSLAQETQRKAPDALHSRIMQRVRLAQKQSIMAPSASVWVALGLAFAVIFMLLPLLAFTDLVTIPLLSYELATPVIPNYVWSSLFMGALLLAADSYVNRPRLKKT